MSCYKQLFCLPSTRLETPPEEDPEVGNGSRVRKRTERPWNCDLVRIERDGVHEPERTGQIRTQLLTVLAGSSVGEQDGD